MPTIYRLTPTGPVLYREATEAEYIGWLGAYFHGLRTIGIDGHTCVIVDDEDTAAAAHSYTDPTTPPHVWDAAREVLIDAGLLS